MSNGSRWASIRRSHNLPSPTDSPFLRGCTRSSSTSPVPWPHPPHAHHHGTPRRRPPMRPLRCRPFHQGRGWVPVLEATAPLPRARSPLPTQCRQRLLLHLMRGGGQRPRRQTCAEEKQGCQHHLRHNHRLASPSRLPLPPWCGQ
jgi:hypothetical protein